MITLVITKGPHGYHPSNHPPSGNQDPFLLQGTCEHFGFDLRLFTASGSVEHTSQHRETQLQPAPGDGKKAKQKKTPLGDGHDFL